MCQTPSRPSVLCLTESNVPDIVIAGMTDRIVTFNGTTGKLSKTEYRTDGPTTAIGIDLSRKMVATATGAPGEPCAIDLTLLNSTGEPAERIARLAGPTDQIFALAFQPNGGRFLTGAGYGKLIHVWDIDKSQQIMVIKEHSDTIQSMAWHPTQPWLATCAADRTVKIWEFPSGRCLHSMNESSDWLNTLHWDNRGQNLVAAGVDRSIRSWEVTANKFTLKKSKFAHERPILSLGLFGSNWLSMGEDKMIKSWDMTDLKEKGSAGPINASLSSMVVSRAGKTAWIGGFDGNVRRLDTDSMKIGATLDIVAPPKVTSHQPNHIPRGSKSSVMVIGNGLNQIDWKQTRLKDATIGTVEIGLDGTRVAIEVEIAPDIIPGPRILDYPMPDGSRQSHDVEITLGLPESTSKTTPLSYQGRLLRAGQVDKISVKLEKNQETGFLVTMTKNSTLDPVIRISTNHGTVVAEGNKWLGFKPQKADQYVIEIHDKEYRQGDQQYWLHIGAFPVISTIFPNALQAGKTAKMVILGVNLGDHQEIELKASPDASNLSRVILPDHIKNLPGGIGPQITEWPQYTQADSLHQTPFGASGILGSNKTSDRWRFVGKKGEKLILEINASRNGSPLDSHLEIRDASGKIIPQTMLQPVAQTIVAFRNHDAKNPGIRLETWSDLTVNDFLYAGGDLMRIRALPRNPDDDCQFFATNGKRQGWLGTTPTQHPIGQTLLKVIPKPPGSIIENSAWPTVVIPAMNDDGPPGYGPDSMMYFDPPTDGEYHVIVQESTGIPRDGAFYNLSIKPAKEDLAISLKSPTSTIGPGGSAEISIDVQRKDGWNGHVELEVVGVPEGWLAPKAYASNMENSATLALYKLKEDAAWPNQLSIKASATLGGKLVSRIIQGPKLSTIQSGDVTIRPEIKELRIVAGEKALLPVVINRVAGFDGRVPLDVRGLPQGVRVLDVGLNGILMLPGQSRRILEIEADSWVTSQSNPLIVTAKREGKPEFIGPLVVLTINSSSARK
jgi:WD40 repeat protein